MNQSFWNKKFPTLVGICVLLFGVVATSVFVQKGTSVLTRADTDSTPRDVRITNLSDTSASISFTTNSDAISTLTYGKDTSQNQTISDIRDTGSTPTRRKTHYFTLTNLAANTAYSFILTANGTEYTTLPEKELQFTTLSPITFTNTNDHKITGKIMTLSGEMAPNVLVYITSESTQEFSALTGLDGSFSVPMQNVRSKDGTQALSLIDTSLLQLAATNGTESVAAVFLFTHAHPLPVITLSHTYDFTTLPQKNPLLLPSSTASASAQSSFPGLTTNSETSELTITTPKNQAKLTDTTPTISGFAKSNETVTITVQGAQTNQVKVLSNRRGNWTYTFPRPLLPGVYTLQMKAKASNGKEEVATVRFELLASSTQTSIPVTPTPTKRLLPTPTPTTRPTRTPTPTIISRSTISSSPTPTPTVLIAQTAEDLENAPPELLADASLMEAATTSDTQASVATQQVLSRSDSNDPTPTEMVLMSTTTLPSGTDPVMISISIAIIVVIGGFSTLFLLKRDTTYSV